MAQTELILVIIIIIYSFSSVISTAEYVISLVELMQIIPHNSLSFTEGYCIGPSSIASDSISLYESTGLWSGSTIQEIDLKTGRILQAFGLNSSAFAEGCTIVSHHLVQLTWKSNFALDYKLPLNAASVAAKRQCSFPSAITEGWGIATVPLNIFSANNNSQELLLISNGTEVLSLLAMETDLNGCRLKTVDKIVISPPLSGLNELEFVNGEIFANIYMTSCIARISPKTGRVLGIILLPKPSSLHPNQSPHDSIQVWNGIAYNTLEDVLYLTGKLFQYAFKTTITNVRKVEGDLSVEAFNSICPSAEYTIEDAQFSEKLLAAVLNDYHELV